MKRATVIYLSPYDILRPRTNQVSDVRFTEGFSQNNCEAYFICPYVKRDDNIETSDINRIYGLQYPVHFHILSTRFKRDVKGKRALVRIAGKSIPIVRSIIKSSEKDVPVIIISRSPFLLVPYLLLRSIGIFRNTKLVYWAHDVHPSKHIHWIYSNCDHLLATNKSILDAITKQSKRSYSSANITSNPITEAQANSISDRQSARHALGLGTLKDPLVVYTGKIGLNYSKELEFILQASAQLPGVRFLLTGGTPEAVAYWKKYAEKIGATAEFTGYIHDYSRIHLYQQAADVLVSYYTNQGHDIRYNLPNKLCEYMLTGNIIVSPDHPATRELLTPENCHFVEAENATALAEGIDWCLSNPELSKRKADVAAGHARQLTFRNICSKTLESFL
jgi:glycosyltransferase involved in cell wall biosynthesis